MWVLTSDDTGFLSGGETTSELSKSSRCDVIVM